MSWSDALDDELKRKRNNYLEKQFRSSPFYQDWITTLTEMGLEEYSNLSPPLIGGNYRKHHIEIFEVTYRSESHGDDASSGDTIQTYYNVELENPQNIMMEIKKRSFFSSRSRSKDIKIDTAFDKEFSVKGTDETKITDILDSFIRNKIMKIRGFNLVIGVDKPHDRSRYRSQTGILYSLPTLSEATIRIGLESRIRKGLESKYDANLARHVDSQPLVEIKRDAEKFRAILDTLIDIIEKVETYPASTHHVR